ncbi:MAG: hypothetical protein KC620_01430 [Myxococcales bacterium]|nr:hypothetical protein [Myxococcales bacterium]
MKWNRTLVLAAAIGLLFAAGCNKPEGGAEGTAAGKEAVKAAVAEMKAPAFMELIPAETPYVFANLQPMPKSAVDKIFSALGPALASLEAQIDNELKNNANPETDQDKVGKAVLEELKGNLNRAGLEKMGFSFETRFALYGNGVLPTFRLGLKDPAALKAAVARVEQKAGVKAPVQKAGDQEYWSVTNDGMTIVFAIVGEEFVLGFAPEQAAAKVVPMILGTEKPAKSLASAGTLAKVMQENGFAGYGTGYIDTMAIADTILGQGAGLNGEIWKAMGSPVPAVDDVCKTEIKGLVSNAPRVVFGYDDLSDKQWNTTFIIETKPALAKELASLVAPVPGLGESPDALMTFGLGVQIQKGLDFVKAKVGAVKAAPYQCQMLADFNSGIMEMDEGLQEAALPPAVTNMRGFNVVVLDGEFGGAMPKNVKGHALLATEKPEELLIMAKGMIPPLASFELKNDGKAVALPPGLLPPMVENPHVAMNDKGIAFSVGAGAEQGLGAVLNAKAPTDAPLFAFGYDVGKFMTMVQKQTEAMMAGMPPEMQEEQKREMAATLGVAKVFGMVHTTVRLSDKGIVIKQRMQLN